MMSRIDAPRTHFSLCTSATLAAGRGRFLLAAMLLTTCFAVTTTTEFATAAETPATTETVAEATDQRTGEIAERNLFVIIQQGGLLLYPILISSFILLLFVFERLISLRRRRVIPKPFVRKFLHQLREGNINQEEALEMWRRL